MTLKEAKRIVKSAGYLLESESEKRMHLEDLQDPFSDIYEALVKDGKDAHVNTTDFWKLVIEWGKQCYWDGYYDAKNHPTAISGGLDTGPGL
jgi:hypothetical protein